MYTTQNHLDNLFYIADAEWRIEQLRDNIKDAEFDEKDKEAMYRFLDNAKRSLIDIDYILSAYYREQLKED